MTELLKISHKGSPCDPPIVEGVTFAPLDGSDLFVGEATQAQADALLRIDAFKLYGGQKAPKTPATPPAGEGPAPIPTDEEVDALTAKKDALAMAAAQKVELAGDKLADMKVELKAALAKLREAASE